ncbi:DUF6406 domain-containing protein [Streptomyces sp. WMMB303]|uniref:DUF6406 domain-containing protein n=1 Tax=Streptomyces sp. WMMB303 TaxID=3034154 RepID=UPI0023EC7946|nr:DUF6406 domain-containing protein [Streptomyces sp. WMMB303]MDF4249028.1 hypothetical protein [Streptomyces sp. WMMB303]
MTAQEIALSPNTQANRDIGSFSVIHVYAPAGQVPTVRLSVGTGGTDTRHSLAPGDVFPVRDQEWKLDHIDNLDSPTDDWTVVLARVK